MEFYSANTQNRFNFGTSIKQWVGTLYENTESTVLHKGYTTDSFKLPREVRQGCPLSPCLFILGAEVLAAMIRQDRSITDKINQFADDTSLFLSNLLSVQNSIKLLDEFGDIS